MKHRSRLLSIVAAIALVGAACADETPDDAPDDAGQEDAQTETEGTDDGDADDADDAADDDPADEGEDDSAAPGADRVSGTTTAGIEVATSDLGDHLVTAEGQTIYAAVDQRDGEVICVADCAQVWPPVIADGEPSIGEDIDAELVTTVALDDGREQVVFDGAPLHTFVADAGAGEVRGQGSAERWFVVSPAGELIGSDDQ